MFASQVGIINFDPAAQDPALFSFAHDLEQLVLQPPSRAIADPDETLKFQGGNTEDGLESWLAPYQKLESP